MSTLSLERCSFCGRNSSPNHMQYRKFIGDHYVVSCMRRKCDRKIGGWVVDGKFRRYEPRFGWNSNTQDSRWSC